MNANVLLTTAQLLLLLIAGTLCHGDEKQGIKPGYSISLTVYNSLLNTNLTFTIQMPYRGNLLGAMRRLEMSNEHFKFETLSDINYGTYLESVNGLSGNTMEHTYWVVLVQHADGTITKPDVDIGCFIPSANDYVILKYTK
ncbi:hypothetical protein GJAV_G00056450 [Gymnothorax javanicus]|nr:hypothetical protein GJAV_G00056450 [Gymnothorax javanicus]